MNTVSAINKWVGLVSDRKTEVQPYPCESREKEIDQPLWKICRSISKAKGGESMFYAFFLLLAVVSTFTAFATLLDMLNAGSLIYFVEHALR